MGLRGLDLKLRLTIQLMVQIFSRYVSLRTTILTLLEGLCIVLAVICGARLRFLQSPLEFEVYVSRSEFLIQLLIVITVFQICFHLSNSYDARSIRSRSDELLRLTQAMGAGAIILALVYTVYPAFLIGRGVFLISVVLIVLFVLSSRVVLDSTWQFTMPQQRVLIFGTTDLGMMVAQELERRKDLNLELTGFISTHGTEGRQSGIAEQYVCGIPEHLEEIVTTRNISRVVVALEDRRGTLPIRELVTLRVKGIYIEDAHSMISALTGRVWLGLVRPSWFVFSEGFRRSRITLFVKRTMDVFCGLIGLIFAAPVMALIAVVVKLDSKGPVIYRQERTGYRDKPFEVLKFRSMRTDAESNGIQWAQVNDPRTTRVGTVLRKYRLDELPQLINILRGDMSFVGPRPERPSFVEQLRKEIPYYDERHSVRPGLTGWAQVEYHYGSTIEDTKRKLEYDLFYLKNLSVFFDIAILLKTCRIVLNGYGGR
jgi:sugar transferase (PEP-CTERM system associated)